MTDENILSEKMYKMWRHVEQSVFLQLQVKGEYYGQQRVNANVGDYPVIGIFYYWSAHMWSQRTSSAQWHSLMIRILHNITVLLCQPTLLFPHFKLYNNNKYILDQKHAAETLFLNLFYELINQCC